MIATSALLPLEQRLCVAIDPRIELLSIVLKLSGYGARYAGRINDAPSAYLSAVEQYFAAYAEHPTLQYFQRSNENISGDLPVAIVLYLSEPPALQLQTPFDAMVQTRAGDAAALEQYVAALRCFAQETDFVTFSRAQQAYYATIIAGPAHSIGSGNDIAALEAYCGAAQRSYNVLFAPLLKSIAFGPRVHWEDGALDTYCVFPAVAVEEGVIQFKEGRGLRNAILHEFGHSFINPLVDSQQDTVSAYAALMQNVKYETNANYGAEWTICVYEHLVRAVTTRLTHAAFGAEEGAKEMAAHIKQGFVYLPALCDRLADYERQRAAYPTFEDFFPILLESFAALSRQAQEELR